MKILIKLFLYSSILGIVGCNAENISAVPIKNVTTSSAPNKVLFVCGGNTGRSPMAEYLANDYFHFKEGGYIADSRGANVDPKEILPESNAVLVMKQLHIDIQKHRARAVTRNDIESSKLVLTMTQSHKQKLLQMTPEAKNIYLLSECATGKLIDVDDAYGQDIEFYEKTRDMIASYIKIIQGNGMLCQKKFQ